MPPVLSTRAVPLASGEQNQVLRACVQIAALQAQHLRDALVRAQAHVGGVVHRQVAHRGGQARARDLGHGAVVGVGGIWGVRAGARYLDSTGEAGERDAISGAHLQFRAGLHGEATAAREHLAVGDKQAARLQRNCARSRNTAGQGQRTAALHRDVGVGAAGRQVLAVGHRQVVRRGGRGGERGGGRSWALRAARSGRAGARHRH